MRNPYWLFVTAVLATGCGSEPLTPADVAGSYALRSIDGASLPWALPSSGECQVTITAGSLELTVDPHFEMLLTQQFTCGTEPPYEVGRLQLGPYRLEGHRLVLVSTSADIVELDARVFDSRIVVDLPLTPGTATPRADFAFGRQE